MTAQFVCTQCFLSFPDLRALKWHWTRAHEQRLPTRPGPFCKVQHSLDGMPQCRHCLQKLGSWHNLQRHIMHNNCPKLWLEEQARTQVTTQHSSADLPGVAVTLAAAETQILPAPPDVRKGHLDEYLTFFTSHSWQNLLEHEELRKLLRQNCAICGQWLVSGTHIKLHMQKSHGDLWEQYGHACTLECCKLAQQVVSPCRWCLRVTANTRQHASKCSVAWQLCLLSHIHCRRHDNGHQRGGGHLRTTPSGPQGSGIASSGSR